MQDANMSEEEKKFSESPKFKIITRFCYGFHCIRSIPHIFLFLTSPSKPVIEKDLHKWIEMEYEDLYQQRLPAWKELVWLLWKQEAFRNLFYYRIRKDYVQ